MKNRKIIIVGTLSEPIPPRYYGGIEEIIYFVVEYLVNTKWQVYLVDLDDFRRELSKMHRLIKTGRLKIIRIPTMHHRTTLTLLIQGLRGFLKTLKILLHDKEIRVISIFYYYPLFPMAYILKLISKFTGRRLHIVYFTAAHYPWLARNIKLRSKFLFPFRKLNKSSADLIITLSKQMATSIHYYLKIPIDKFRVVHDCYDDEEYDYKNPEFLKIIKKAEDLRNRIDLKDKIIVLYLARFNSEKGIDDLIKAMDLLKKKDEDKLRMLKVIIAGKADYATLFKYKNLVHSLGLNGTIKVVGSVSRDMVKFLYALADLYILPTRLEAGPPISLLQAVASGVPAITTKYALIPELLPIKYACVEEPFPEELYKILRTIIEHREILNNLWQEEYKIIKRKYNKLYCGKKYIEIYNELL